MKIIAGLGYDDRLPNHIPDLFDSQLCGEQGLVTALEFRAGIIVPDHSQAARTVAYLNALKANDNGSRFYSKSLAVDPTSSAESLLAWRDWAILHGWTYGENSANSGRLSDLADVEPSFTKTGSSLGERIYSLLPRLHLLVSSVSTIVLHHSRTSWPPLFQKLFMQLETAGVDVLEVPHPNQPQARADCDLGKLQRAMIGQVDEPLTFKQDGTIRLFSADDEQIAAQFAVRAADEETLIISPSSQHCLATAICQLGGNHSGLGDSSIFRAPNQLLLLIFQCAWQTPSAEALLQYLTLPAGRFQSLRQSLAKRFRDVPGFDREHWDNEINEFVNRSLEKQSVQSKTELLHQIEEWLPISVCPSDEHMPMDLAITLSDRVANYWKDVTNTAEEEQLKTIFSATFAASDAVCQALREWSEPTISKIQLNRLINLVLSAGRSQFRDKRTISKLDIVNRPEVVPLRSTPINQALWFNPSVSESGNIPPFSKEELDGIPLAPKVKQLAILKQLAFERSFAPILAAKESITLISTDSTPELLKLHISSLLKVNHWPKLEDAILGDSGLHTKTQPVNEFRLPLAQRWWKPGCNFPCPQPNESYSTLTMLAFRPHEYTLKYVAKLREGSIRSLTADNRLKGNVAHDLVDMWFNEHKWTGKRINREDIKIWLEKTLPRVIQRTALPLAQPGMHVERLKFQQQMLEALDKLLQALVASKAVRVESERYLQLDDSLTQLDGRVDILCEFEDEGIAVIDMKWGSYDRYKDELKAGRALQLATYARIANGEFRGQFADAGYFILNRAELLCNQAIVFPTATVVEPDEPTSLKLTWTKFENTLRWRIKQLNEGQIEITYGTEPPGTESQPPDDALGLVSLEEKMKKKRYKKNKASFKPIDIWRNLTGNIKEH